jgi:hypothetical protein
VTAGQALACFLCVAVGIAGIAAAVNPALPVLRSAYWWRILFRRKGRPSTFERFEMVAGGVLWIVFGGGLFIYTLVVH